MHALSLSLSICLILANNASHRIEALSSSAIGKSTHFSVLTLLLELNKCDDCLFFEQDINIDNKVGRSICVVQKQSQMVGLNSSHLNDLCKTLGNKKRKPEEHERTDTSISMSLKNFYVHKTEVTLQSIINKTMRECLKLKY